jgi:Fungal protein kinase
MCTNVLRQGTLPFVSLSVLRQVTTGESKNKPSTIRHEIEDDLEAFFYVFIWICVLYAGPDGVFSTAPQKKQSIIQTWGEAAMQSGLENARRAKNEFIYAPNDTIPGEFSEYFKNLAPLAIEWQDEVRKDDARRVRIEARAKSGEPSLESDTDWFSHQKIIDLIRKHLHLAR